MIGRIPTPTLWIFESLGLTGFVAVVGLAAGPDFVRGLQTSGISLIVAERWLGESEQSDKWVPCLIAALLPRSRRDHVETFATQPQPYIQGEGGLGCDQG
jgi:Predicted Permease Membrane Region